MFVGIDLAADPVRTGFAVMRGDGRSVLESVEVGAEDETIIEAIRIATRAGVDVPLGWPEPFVDLVREHAAGTLPAPGTTGPQWRRALAMRTTDREVHRRIGLTPLSVSTDRIAHPAMRWAGIEARLRELGLSPSRDGSGVICEVYPAAALRCWSLPYRGYKGMKNSAARADLVARLSRQLSWLDWNGHQDLCAADDNALDAVLAAVIAREVELSRCVPPPDELRDVASREGWIWLPQ